MRGHESIIAMRKQRTTPGTVFINDFPCDTDWFNPGAQYGQVWASDHATVSTAGDVIQMLDMRFLVGLQVIISSESETRAKALFEKAKASGAKTIAAAHVVGKTPREMATGWFEIYRKQEVANG
jgi:hypothetical protein